MKKAIAILLTALLLLTVFVSCEGDVEDLFGDNITITFDGNGSTSGQMAALKVARGKEVRLTANAYEKTDSEFTGWNTKADGSGDKYKDEQFVYFEEDTTLYAQWGDVGVTITFNANDGSGSMEPVKVSADVYELPENGFTAPEGYAFVRWSETAEGEVEYEVGDELVVTEDVTLYAIWAQVLSETPDLLLSGRYTITENTPIDNRFGASGTLKLYLPDDLTLNAKKGITVSDGNTLVIDKVGTNGNGKLIAATDEWDKSGIGGGENQAGGIITINGGTVTATGGSDAAGIGGGLFAAGGTITITGGEVTATGGIEAAGIGGGGYGNGGKVTIEGGTVTANGGEYGAGIGGGNHGVGGKITINGGTVTANGGEYAAGIGGGNEGSGGEVTIAGGTVTATGGEQAAGIGGGVEGDGGTVTISGGTVTATGGEDVAGIGKGFFLSGGSDGTLKIGDGVIMMVSTDNTDWSVYNGSTRTQYMKVPEPTVLTSSTTAWTSGNVYTLGNVDVTIDSRITVSGSVGLLLPDGRKLTASKGITVTESNSLTINGGTGQNAGILEATGGDRAAGIGGGYEGAGGTVTINGGTVTATGGEYAAGIGGGWYGTTGGTVTINGGTVEAIGGSSGAGIGGGYYGVGGTVTINNGTVTATGVSGGAGIGGGYYKAGGTVTISGGSVTANGGQDAHGIGRGYGGGSDETLTLTGVSMEVSEDNTSWTDYDGSTRKRYMKTK